MSPDRAATRQHLFFEDFAAGRVFELGTRILSEEEIVAFASEWDPRIFTSTRSRPLEGRSTA